MITRFIYTSLLLLLTQLSTGQIDTSPIRITNFTITNGLPGNVINNVMQDSRGFVWLSTTQGLVRYDGKNFTIYRHNSSDSNSMPFDNVNDCIELNSHELIYNSGGKMWMLNPENDRQHPPTAFWKNKKECWPRKISNDIIVIQTENSFYFADMSLRLIDSVISPVSKGIFEAFYIGDNKVLTTDLQHMFCYSLHDKKMEEWQFDKASLKKTNALWAKDIDTINKKIYISGYENGVFLMSYDKASPVYLKAQTENITTERAVRDIMYQKDILVTSSLGGITIQQAGKPELILKNIPGDNSSILPGNLDNIFSGRNGQYWVTGDNGVSYFNLNQIQYQYWQLPYQATINHYSKHDGKIWMSSENKGSLALNTVTNKLAIIDSNIIQYCWGAVPVNNQIYLYGNSIAPRYANNKNNVKLLAFNPSSSSISAPSFITPFYHGAELITLVYQSKNGDVWYSINNGNGLVKQKAGSNHCIQYRRKDSPSPFNFGYLNKAAEDKNGNIYFSVNKDAKILVWKNKEEQFETWKMDSLLGNSNIHFGPLQNHIIDSKQNLWLCYEGLGLVKYNLETHKSKLYETKDGLPYNMIDNLVADGNDNIWIPTPKGLCCLLASTGHFITFTQSDGLPFTGFDNCYLFFDKDDTSLYFNKEKYLYKINSDALLKQRIYASASLVLEGMMVNTKPYLFTPGNTIQLLPDENNLQFSFTLTDIENKINEREYEYRLANGNDSSGWQQLTGAGNTVMFYHLAPGQYTLQVRMYNTATGTYINSNIYSFSIATVWYKTWWFRLLAVTLLLAILFIIVRGYYLCQLQKQKALLEKEKALEAERQRIAADMHDDIGAGLSRIRYITAAMKEGRNISTEDMDKILSLSDESVEKMNEIIWSLNQGNQQLSELIYHIRSHCAEMITNAGIEFTCTMPDEIPAITMEWKQTRNIYLLVKEAVNNAVKHSKAKNISLSFSINDVLQIVVKDDGIGFSEETISRKGNGLLNYKKRLAILEGAYNISSAAATGTEISFTVPVLPKN